MDEWYKNNSKRMRRLVARLAVEAAVVSVFGMGESFEYWMVDELRRRELTTDGLTDIGASAMRWLIERRGGAGSWDYLSDEELEVVSHECVTLIGEWFVRTS